MTDDKETKGTDWLALGGAAVHSIQAGSLTTKAITALIIYGLATALVWFLCQKPADESGADKSADVKKAQVSSENNMGIVNSGTQTASATSTGNNTGTVAGIIINQSPPATEDQKKQQIAQLQSEIEELAENRGRLDLPPPVTILEEILTNKYARQLSLIVDKYYKQVLLGAKHGDDLILFRKNYREFFEKELMLENDVATFVGTKVDVRFRYAWFIYVRYFMFRRYGMSKEQIEGGGNFLNYGITWDEAERVYNLILSNKELSEAVTSNSNQLNYVVDKAKSILDDYA